MSNDQAESQPLEVYFADEEGDPFAVELAGRVGAYVVAQDSDYVILNAEGYRGYIPMQDIVWTGISSDPVEELNGDNDDGFQTVVSKSKKKASALQSVGTSYGIVPPEDVEDLQLSVLVFSPAAIASHLQIPESLLPLLASLVGNDFTGNKDSSITTQQINLQWLFFDRKLSLSQRVLRVAQTLRSILAAALSPAAKGKPKLQVGSVMQLIERAVTVLTIRPTDHMASGERAKIIEIIVEATLRYAIPRPHESDSLETTKLWHSSLCPLHEESSCSLVSYFTPTLPQPPNKLDTYQHRIQIRRLYISAYRDGRLGAGLLDVLNTGTFWCHPFLENPDLETVWRSISRPINGWCFSLLEDGIGLIEREDDADEGSENRHENGEEDEDELVDVIEDFDEDDPLAPLRGALQKLDHSDDEDSASRSPSIASRTRKPRHTPQKVVTEYLRKGTRLAPEIVTVPFLAEVIAEVQMSAESNLPMQLRSEDERLTFLLRCLDSDTPRIRALPPAQLAITLTLRWVVSRLNVRVRESNGSKDRVNELWTKQEARAFLASFSPLSLDILGKEYPPIVDRNVQLVSQVFAAYKSIQLFVGALLLPDRAPDVIRCFSGTVFHSYLTGMSKIPTEALYAGLWDACVENLEGSFATTTRERKGQKSANDKPLGRNSVLKSKGSNGNGQRGGYGKFGLLAGLGA